MKLANTHLTLGIVALFCVGATALATNEVTPQGQKLCGTNHCPTVLMSSRDGQTLSMQP